MPSLPEFIVHTKGKYELFKNGWVPVIAKAELYAEEGTLLIDTQDVTFAYNSADKSIRPTAAIVFDVPEGAEDVQTIVVCIASGSALFHRSLDTSYDFPTEGTLTVDSWVLTLTGSLTDEGKAYLWQSGLEASPHYLALYATTTAKVSSAVNKAFAANASNGKLEMTSSITLEIPASTTGINRVGIRSNPSLPGYYFYKDLGTTYNYTNAGSFKINDFALVLT